MISVDDGILRKAELSSVQQILIQQLVEQGVFTFPIKNIVIEGKYKLRFLMKRDIGDFRVDITYKPGPDLYSVHVIWFSVDTLDSRERDIDDVSFEVLGDIFERAYKDGFNAIRI